VLMVLFSRALSARVTVAGLVLPAATSFVASLLAAVFSWYVVERPALSHKR